MTNFISIEIPTVESLKLMTLEAKEREYREYQNSKEAFIDDIPKFFEFISKQLKYSAMGGNSELRINFDDDRWNYVKDKRVAFHFNGRCSIEAQVMIEKLFNTTFIQASGCEGHISFLCNSTYRLGEIYLSW
jgi:hypothetical protein